MPFFCYLVKCNDGSLYCGWTTNPTRRTAIHNSGRGSHYTRLHRPVMLVYQEELTDRSSAMRREYQMKKLTHVQKLQLIQDYENGQPARSH